MFENWQGINPMGLSASLVDKKTLLNKHENVSKILKMKHKKIKEYNQCSIATLGLTLLLELFQPKTSPLLSLSGM